MTELRQAAQAALDALESDAIQRTFAGGVRMSNAAIALRAALAQPPAPTAQPAESTAGQPLRSICWANCPCRKAAQPVQQPGAEPEPIMVEAVAEVRSGAEGLYLDWLIEGGICALVEGCVLVMPTQPITDDDGSGEVYLAAPAQRQPLTPSLRRAAEFTRADLGPAGSNYPHVRELLAFAEQALGITAAPAAQKGKKL